MRALRLRPEDSCRVSFACCYTYAGWDSASWSARGCGGHRCWNLGILASGIWHRHLVNLPLRSHNNNTMPLRVFTRRHYNVLEAGGTNRWWLGGGWCKPRVPPKIAKIGLRIIRVCRINGVLIRMGRLKSPYDPSLACMLIFFCLVDGVRKNFMCSLCTANWNHRFSSHLRNVWKNEHQPYDLPLWE